MVICWLLARSLSKPLLAIKGTAASFGDGNFSARVDKATSRNDELGELARSFNKMADKLATNMGAHQRLLADVSHELRSPMTRLQIAIALANKTSSQPEELEKHLTRCELEVTRLDEMISDVLSLSRLENTFQQIELDDICLAELLTSTINDAQYLADEKQIIINHQIEDPLIMPADSHLLASAFNNVLSNAIKYSAIKSSIEVTLSHANSYAKLTISDYSGGVPESALTELFKPFYRVSTARDRATGGTGLGLAITQQAIIAHNGTITAENNDSGGLTITVKLPLNKHKAE